MSKAVIGTMSTPQQTQSIVDELQTVGFVANDVSVLFPDRKDTESFAKEMETKAPEGAAIGAATGGTAGAWLGGGLGLLTGLGAIIIPGLGPFLAIGPLLGLLGGAAVGATVGVTVGTFAGALIAMGIPEHQAKHYEARVGEGRILIAVHTEDRQKQAQIAGIIQRHGGEDVSYVDDTKVPALVPATPAP
jgi:hypothetical protein